MSLTAQYEAKPAMTGEMSAGMRTLPRTAPKLTPCTPAPTMTAPTRPPKRACEELEGRPTSQVSRFQMMAPISPAKMNSGPMVTWASLMMPPEMVLATSVERNAPTRFKVPAAMTAVLGLSAPVAMEVAMALAVSWKPLVKSKMSALAMTRTTTARVAISMVALTTSDRLHVPAYAGFLQSDTT